jgi:hypothetical protein
MRITIGQLRRIIRETIEEETRRQHVQEGLLDSIKGLFGGGKKRKIIEELQGAVVKIFQDGAGAMGIPASEEQKSRITARDTQWALSQYGFKGPHAQKIADALVKVAGVGRQYDQGESIAVWESAYVPGVFTKIAQSAMKAFVEGELDGDTMELIAEKFPTSDSMLKKPEEARKMILRSLPDDWMIDNKILKGLEQDSAKIASDKKARQERDDEDKRRDSEKKAISDRNEKERKRKEDWEKKGIKPHHLTSDS